MTNPLPSHFVEFRAIEIVNDFKGVTGTYSLEAMVVEGLDE